MGEIAIFGWGIIAGVTLATWRARKPPPAEAFGVRLASDIQQTIQRASFAGPGFTASTLATLEVSGRDVEICISVKGEAGPEMDREVIV